MSSLRNKTSKALFWDLSGNYGGQLILFIISIFLARLLSPEDFGVVGMSMVFIHILRVFADMGFAAAIIQNQQNSSLTYSSVFYLNIAIGALFTCVLFFSSPYIGSFYDNVKVTYVLQWLSVLFVINSFNIVQATILKKDLNFRYITLVLLSTQSIAGVLAVGLAYMGYGVYALVFQQILSSFLNVVCLWNITGWYPSLKFSWTEIKKLSSFSSFFFFGQFLNQIFKQLDTLAVGKMFSASVLGFFSRAESINSLISKNSVSTFNRVFFPVLSTLQHDNQKFSEVYFRVLEIVSIVAVFISGLFFLIGQEFIIGLFGNKWQPSVIIFQVLILKGFSYPLNALIVNTFLAKGKARENFNFGNVRRLLQLIPLAVAYLYGFEPFLYAVIIISILTWLLNAYFLKVSLGFSFKRQVLRVFYYLLIAAIPIWLLHFVIFSNELNYMNAFFKVLIYGLYVAAFLYLTNSIILVELKKAWVSIRKVLKK